MVDTTPLYSLTSRGKLELWGMPTDRDKGATMSSTNRRRRDDRRAELQRFQYWLETEYEVMTDWSYSPRGMLGQHARAVATITAYSTDPEYALEGRWELSGEIVMDGKGTKELQAHMLLLSKLMLDLQLFRMYGTQECEYWLLSPPPVE